MHTFILDFSRKDVSFPNIFPERDQNNFASQALPVYISTVAPLPLACSSMIYKCLQKQDASFSERQLPHLASTFSQISCLIVRSVVHQILINIIVYSNKQIPNMELRMPYLFQVQNNKEFDILSLPQNSQNRESNLFNYTSL